MTRRENILLIVVIVVPGYLNQPPSRRRVSRASSPRPSPSSSRRSNAVAARARATSCASLVSPVALLANAARIAARLCARAAAADDDGTSPSPSPASSPRGVASRCARRVRAMYARFAHASTAIAAYADCLPGPRPIARRAQANMTVRATLCRAMWTSSSSSSSSSTSSSTSAAARMTRKKAAIAAAAALVVVGVVVATSPSSTSSSFKAFVDATYDAARRLFASRRHAIDDGGGGGDGGGDDGGFVDPELPVYVAGCESCANLERRLGTPLWAWFVDALGVSKTSAGRAHIANVLTRDETTHALDGMFDALCERFSATRVQGEDSDGDGERALRVDGLLAFSAGVQGTIREVMSHAGSEIPRASGDEREFLRKHYEVLFPKEAPLNRETFHALAKLILVRRILKALARDFGLVALRSGLSAPLVVDVKVVLPAKDGADEDVVFRLHTVAPKSDATQAGARLGAISE